MEKKTTYDDVNKGVKEVLDWLYSEAIEKVWNDMRDLKLHDVFFDGEEHIAKFPLVKEERSADDLFYRFCEFSYEDFKEWMAEEEIADARKYVGRTSKFYLTDLHDRTKELVLDNLIGEVMGGVAYCFFDKDCRMTKVGWDSYTEDDILEMAQEEMKYFANGEFLKDAKEYLSDAVKEAEYIDSFKERQLERFDEFLENLNDELEYEAERKRIEEERIQAITMACYI